MNVLVVPVPGGADQFAQLVGIVDGLCRALTDLRRAALQDPLADRGPVARGDRLGQASVLLPPALRGIGSRGRRRGDRGLSRGRSCGRGR